MFNYDNMLNTLNREKRRIEDMIQNCQNQPQPVNNFINTNQSSQKDLIEWRILNENEEVDNLYVQNNTLFINDNLMVKKSVDGSLEKWEVKKIYPIDKKDQEISELKEEIKKLKEMMSNEYAKSNEPTREFKQSISTNDVDVEPKSKTNGKQFSK